MRTAKSSEPPIRHKNVFSEKDAANAMVPPEGAQQEAKTPANRRPFQTNLFLVLIVALGIGLRLWGIGWSLPDKRHPLATYHPDERINLSAAMAADIPHGNLDIGFYSYGAFYFYLVSIAEVVGKGYGVVPTAPTAPDAPQIVQMQNQAPEQAGLFLMGRLVTALMGTLTIPVVFGLGRRCFGSAAGLFSALLYAIAPLAVVHAHFLTVDVPATLFVTLALLWSIRLEENRGWKQVVGAGVWVGLAAGTKYTAGAVVIAPMVALVLKEEKKGRLFAHLAGLVAVSCLTFLIACPGPLINWNAFWNGAYPGSGLYYELFVHSRQGHGPLFVATGPGWWYHLRISLLFGLGPSLLLAAGAGVLRALRCRTREDGILLAFFLVYYLATGLSAVRFARYMIPLFPVLCVLVGRLCAECGRLPRHSRVWLGAGGIVVALTAAYTVSLVRLMAMPDPRDLAGDYLERTAPQGASIAFAKIPWFFSPPLSPWFSSPVPAMRRRAEPDTTRFQLRIPATEWDPSVLTPPPDYVVISNIETMHEVERLRIPAAVDFVAALPPHPREYSHAVSIIGLPKFGPIVPDDILYIMPTIRIYPRK